MTRPAVVPWRTALQRACAALLPTAVLLPPAWLAPAEAATDATRWNLTAGTEYGKDSSRGSMMSVDYADARIDAPAGVSAGISGLHTDAPAASADTVSTTREGHALYGTGRLRGGFAFASTQESGYRRSQQWTGTLEAGVRGWLLDLNGSTRHTRFDSFPSSMAAAGELSTSTVGTRADCSLDDLGLAFKLSYAPNAWSGYASAAGNRFDPVNCSFTSKVAGVSRRLASSNFQTLAGPFIDHARLRAGGSIGITTELLQSQFAAGAARTWRRGSLAFDYSHAKSEYGAHSQDGYSVSGTFPLAAVLSIRVTAGTTITDSVGAPYVGAYFLLDW